MVHFISLWMLMTTLLINGVTAFVTRNPPASPIRQSTQIQAFDISFSDHWTSKANSVWLATIDADISSIPNDQFGLVFAGGIAVMLGGVLSALFVGFLLDKGDLYANLAAESYLQSADNEEFWKNLSEEEQVKARELMKKIKASKDGGETAPELNPDESTVTTTASLSTPSPAKPKERSKPADMFSDYGD